MRGLHRSSLFHIKSKSSLRGRDNNTGEGHTSSHARQWSTSSSSSTASHTSTTTSPDKLYDPLSLHPPLRLNFSPHIISEQEDEQVREQDERESRFFNQTRHAVDHMQDESAYSPIKGHNCFFMRPSDKLNDDDRNTQWPLKDWQTISSGLAELDSSVTSSPPQSPTSPGTHRRRPTGWMNDHDNMLKRGDWKRRGIVFHLGSNDEGDQEQHFELPE